MNSRSVIYPVATDALRPKPVRVIGKWRFAVLLSEQADQLCLDLTRDSSGRLFPSDDKLIGVGELPYQPTAPVAYRLACPEARELHQAPSEFVGFPNV